MSSAASLRGHAGIDEADEIRERVVAEDHVHLRVILFVAVNVVELFGPAVGESTVAVSMKIGTEMSGRERLRRSPASSYRKLLAMPATSSETLPSDGQAPLGFTPKTRSCSAMLRWICSRASSGCWKR